jgi:hypothetical protein
LIALLALALQAAAAAAPEPAWQGLGVHGGFDTSYDPASLQTEGTRVRVRIRGVTRAAGADGISLVTGTTEIDCAAGTATTLDAKGYDAAGRLVLNAVVPASERQAEPIRPDSPNAAVRARVCARPAR